MIARRSLSLLTLTLASAAILFCAPRAHAAWGELDSGFAAPAGYTQQLPAGSGYGLLDGVVIQPDGKILVGGSMGVDFFGRNSAVQRLLPDGSPDSSFGNGGSAVLSAPASTNGMVVKAIALQPDGKIVAVASGNTESRVFRLTSSGALDTSFASPNGYVVLTNEFPSDVMLHSSGDIYVASYGGTGDPVLRRYNTSGTEIGTFRTTSTSNLSSVPWAGFQGVYLRQLGSGVLVVSSVQPVSDMLFFAAKLDTTGALDSSWGTGGKTTVSFSTSAEPDDVLVQPSGAVVIGGATQVMGDAAWTLARLNSGGTLDPTFAGGGKQEINPTPGADFIGGLAATPGGGIVAVGSVSDAANNYYIGAVRMMTADGVAESGFGPDGMRFLTLSGSVSFYRAAVQPDGKVLAVGSQLTPNPGAKTLPITARYRDAAPPVLTAKISSPSKSKVSAKKLKKFGGTASASFGSIAKVEIALQKVDSKLLKKKKQCLWLSSSKAKFKKSKAVAKKCSKQRWLAATGTGNWSYKLKTKLPKGKYVLNVRATTLDGGATVQSALKTKKFKVT